MKKLICAAAVAAVVGCSGAYAGGYTEEPAAPCDWTGFYVGGDAGYIWGDANLFDVNGYNTTGTNANNPFHYHPDGGMVAAHAGYDFQLNHMFLIGAELQGGYMGLQGSRQYPPYIGVRAANDSLASTNDGWYISTTGRLGVIIKDEALLYGKGGYAWTGVDSTFIDTVTTDTTLSGTTKPERDGWVAGAGLEYMFTCNWFGRVEYDHYDFGTARSSGLGSNGTTYRFDHKLTANSVMVGASYKFHSV